MSNRSAEFGVDGIVVVGASLAGLRAVEALRRWGHAGPVTLLGAEAHLPYDRPPLSKQLLTGAWTPDRLRFRQKDGFEGLDTTMCLGTPVTALDDDRQVVVLADGGEVAYGGLVIATGARARTLPNPDRLGGVHTLRTLDDGIALRDALATATRVAVVGAGFIGLEVASACRARGLPVTAIEMAEVPLQGALGAPVAEALLALHRSRGVAFRTGVAVTGLEGEGGKVTGVCLSDGGRLAADLVVVGIGVTPNVEWLEGSGVRVEDGVMCDARCATTAPNVVAAGDVASSYHPRLGAQLRVEHWTHAVEMANAAVARLLEGPDVPAFSPVPYVWSDQYDLKLQIAGHIPEAATPHVLEGSLSGEGSRPLVVAYTVGDEVTGALTWNRPRRLMQLRRAIAAGATLDAVREAPQ